jgi:hypothetical protein
MLLVELGLQNEARGLPKRLVRCHGVSRKANQVARKRGTDETVRFSFVFMGCIFFTVPTDLKALTKKCPDALNNTRNTTRLGVPFPQFSELFSSKMIQDEENGRNFSAPLFVAPVFDGSTSNSVRQSAESNVCATESEDSTVQIIRLVERLRDLQRIVLPTQVVEAPDGLVAW